MVNEPEVAYTSVISITLTNISVYPEPAGTSGTDTVSLSWLGPTLFATAMGPLARGATFGLASSMEKILSESLDDHLTVAVSPAIHPDGVSILIA